MNPQDLLNKAQLMSQQTKAQGATPFLGSSFDSTMVDATKVSTPTTPLNLKPSPQVQIPNITNLVSSEVANPVAPVVPEPQKTSLTDKIAGLFGQTKNKEADLASAVETATSPYSKQLNELNTQIKMQQAKAIANQEAAINRVGGTTTSNSIAAQQQERTDAIETLKLSALAEGMRGNIALAESVATNAINAKYAQINADLEIAKSNIYDNWDSLTPAEKKRAEATLLRIDKEDQFVKMQMEDDKSVQNMGLELAKNGVDLATVQKVLSADSFDEAISLAGSKLQDPTIKLKLESLRLDNILTKEKIATAQKERSLLGEPTPAEKKATEAALKEAEASVPVMQDKITAVDTLMKHSGLKSRVGTGILSRSPQGFMGTVGKTLSVAGILGLPGDFVAKLSGSGQEFAGGVHKLTGGLTLQSLIDAKSRGATFGALSEGELKILADSATALNDWEIKDDKGVGTGFWNIDEASFKKELKTIQDLTRRALQKSQGSLLTPEDKAILDAVFSPELSPANYY